MRDDPELTHAVIHALNEWMHETWTFNYEDRIFTTPVITLPIVEKAIEELEWCVERGAKTVLIRPAPVPGYRGSRSFGFEEFDPFWQAVVDADILVSMHASDSGYSRYQSDWTGPAGDAAVPARPVPHADAWASGRSRTPWRRSPATACFTRFPDLRVAAIENGGDWVDPVPRRTSRTPTGRCRRRSTRTRSRRSSATSGSARSTRTTSAGLDRRHRRRPHPVRVRLPAPRGPGRAVQLRRPPARRACPTTTSPRSWAATSPSSCASRRAPA